MSDEIQTELKKLEEQGRYMRKILNEPKDRGDKESAQKGLDEVLKKMTYLERVYIIDFKNEEEKTDYIELVKQGEFEKLDRDFPITD